MGCTRGPVGSGRKGQERQELRYELEVQACACGVMSYRSSESKLEEVDLPSLEGAHPLL